MRLQSIGMLGLLAQARVWHYYLSIFLIIPTVLVVVGIIIGYLYKVTGPKYGRR